MLNRCPARRNAKLLRFPGRRAGSPRPGRAGPVRRKGVPETGRGSLGRNRAARDGKPASLGGLRGSPGRVQGSLDGAKGAPGAARGRQKRPKTLKTRLSDAKMAVFEGKSGKMGERRGGGLHDNGTAGRQD